MSARSPIDPTLLRPVLAPTLGTRRTLPAEAYTSQEVFDWEVEHFFEGGWVCVGRAEDVAAPGDQKAFRIGDEGILVVRDLEGTSAASTTPAATAATSCWSPARRGT